MSDGRLYHVDTRFGVFLVRDANGLVFPTEFSSQKAAEAKCDELNRLARREAASGELLAACKMFLRWHNKSSVNPTHIQMSHVLEACESAIRAAEGEEAGR